MFWMSLERRASSTTKEVCVHQHSAAATLLKNNVPFHFSAHASLKNMDRTRTKYSIKYGNTARLRKKEKKKKLNEPKILYVNL